MFWILKDLIPNSAQKIQKSNLNGKSKFSCGKLGKNKLRRWIFFFSNYFKVVPITIEKALISLNPVRWWFVVPDIAWKTKNNKRAKNTPEYKVSPNFQWSEQWIKSMEKGTCV